MNNIEQGLAIMVMGLSITFSALALFIGVIILLQRLFPASEVADSTEEKAVEQPAISWLARDTGEEEIAVAISVALAHLYSYELCRSNLGETLERGHGPWWNAGQWQHFALGSVEIRGRN